MSTGPQLDMPVVYDFTISPAPVDHVVKRRLVHVDLPDDAYVRGIEIGVGADQRDIVQRGPSTRRPSSLVIHIEWSEPTAITTEEVTT